MNVLKAHVVRIDRDSGKVQFLKRSPASADAEFAMSYSARGIPVIETAFLTGKSARFLVDSGWTSAGILKEKTFDEMWRQGSLAEPGMALSLKFEGFSFERYASMKVPQPDRFSRRQRFFSRGNLYNVLGLGFLSAYDVIFDFPNECLYLQRGKLLAESLPDSQGVVPSEYEKIITDYQESIRLDPKDADGYVARGGEWLEKRQYRKAITDCTKAIRLNPKILGAYSIRGRARLKLDENPTRAFDDIEEHQRLMGEFLDFCDALLLVR
jgi:tetratricopeptide (TPR) repeat protein